MSDQDAKPKADDAESLSTAGLGITSLDKLRELCLATPKDTIDTAVDWCIQYIAMLQDDLDRVESVSGYSAYKAAAKGSHFTRDGYLAHLRRQVIPNVELRGGTAVSSPERPA